MVLLNEALLLSWQIPEADSLTLGSLKEVVALLLTDIVSVRNNNTGTTLNNVTAFIYNLDKTIR